MENKYDQYGHQLNDEGLGIDSFDIDGAFDAEPSDFSLLPAGDYAYRVVNYSIGTFEGSEKSSPCRTIDISLNVTDGQNTSSLSHRFFCREASKGFLASFLVSTGVKKPNEPITNLRKALDQTVGCLGRCRIAIDEFKGRDGQMKKSNKINRFYAPLPETPKNTSAEKPTWQNAGL